MPDATDQYEHVHPRTVDEWRAWLQANHATTPGAWCVFFKKATKTPAISYDEAVSEGLCFGWIDSLPRTVDNERHRLLFTPRKPGSGWSRPNKLRVQQMIESGHTTPAGQAVIDAAKADGSLSRLDDVENLIVPDDLAAALAERPPAAEHWEAFPRSIKRGILEWILNAKRPATRMKRVIETAEKAQRNERANQWR